MKQVEKQPLLFLSGWSYDVAFLSPFLDQLSEMYQVRAVDFTNMKPSSDCVAWGHEMLEAYMEEVGEPVVLCGWSLGSLVATELAMENRDRISHIILIAGTACFTKKATYSDGWHPRIVKRMKRQLIHDEEAVLTQFDQALFGDSVKPSVKAYVREYRERIFSSHQTSLIQGLDDLLEIDNRELIQHIQQPLLWIHGIEDAICPVNGMNICKQEMKRPIETLLLEDIGHIPFLEAPEVCAAAIKQFTKGQSVRRDACD